MCIRDRYWSEDAIDVNTRERIDKIVTGEYDEKIRDRVREKTIRLNDIRHFRALPDWLACYVVYDRHSETREITEWKSPEEIDEYIRNFKQHSLRNPIVEQVITEMGEITVHGKIISFDTREIRNEKTIIIFSVTDFTDTITVKMFAKNEQLPEILGELKKGAFVKVKGVTTIDKFDGELTIASVTGIKKIGDFTVQREDLSPIKRVELHCHTKMSDMDGVSEVKDIVKRAHDWGHPAIAITDHGVAQAFPDANHYLSLIHI